MRVYGYSPASSNARSQITALENGRDPSLLKGRPSRPASSVHGRLWQAASSNETCSANQLGLPTGPTEATTAPGP